MDLPGQAFVEPGHVGDDPDLPLSAGDIAQHLDRLIQPDAVKGSEALVDEHAVDPDGAHAVHLDNIGKADSTNTGSSIPNKVWGLEGWIGCNWEFMDNVGVNIPTFAQWKKDGRIENIGAYPIDAKWHIYDPVTKTERVVQGITNNGTCIARLKHGRYCDIIASSCNSDSSKWNKCYAAVNNYTATRGRVVGRAYNNASASGGCVFAIAHYGSAYSYVSSGGRLSFCGKFENENEIDDEAANA